mgnify:CR=1 FL=1
MAKHILSESPNELIVTFADGYQEYFLMCAECTKAQTLHPPQKTGKSVLLYNPAKEEYRTPTKVFLAPEIINLRCHGCGLFFD